MGVYIQLNNLRMKILLAAVVLFVSSQTNAQPFNLDEKINPTELKLVKNPDSSGIKKGRINITEATQVKDTMYYFVNGLSIYSPTYFSISQDETTPGDIQIRLCKENWAAVDISGNTGSSLQWETNFKTEQDFGIMVIGPKRPVKYSMLVWSGDDKKTVEIPSAFTTYDKVKGGKSGGGFGGKILYIVIGLLAAAVIFLLIKRKKSKIADR
jgi:hypothetical protein